MGRIRQVLSYLFLCTILLGGFLISLTQDNWLPKQAKAETLQQGFTHEQTYSYITKVNIGEDNYLYINVKGNFSENHGCPERWFTRSKYPLSDVRTQAQLQTALKSFEFKRQIFVQTFGCSNKYPILTQLQVQQE